MTYRTRKEQIEKDFLRRIAQELRKAGCPLNRQGKSILKDDLRVVAMIAAYEERDRTLKTIPKRWADKIKERSVLNVLGYE